MGTLIRAKHTDDLDDFSLATPVCRRSGSPRGRGSCSSASTRTRRPSSNGSGTSCPHLERFDFGRLRVAHTETYEVDSNWKFIGENYSECYHCPGIHPQLNKLTPYDLGGDYAPDGPWQGGWMELVDDAETMALEGGHRAGRPAMHGITAARRSADLLLPPVADDLPVDPPRLPARPPARTGRSGPHADRLPVAVRAGDDRRARVRPERRRSRSGT